jgi:uncharacterized membrane-anchored protein YjiN (DUF445 family)
MRRLYFLCALALCAAVAQAQTHAAPANAMPQDAIRFADGLCDCMEDMLKQLHPALQTLLADMVDVGLEEAQSRLEKKLMEATQEDQMKIMTDAEKMATIDQQLQDNCSHLESIGSKYDNHEEFLNAILDQLKDLKDCTLTYKTMKLGLSGKSKHP